MKIFLAVLTALAAAFAATAGFGQMGMMQRGGAMNMSAVRHQYVRQHRIDASYARLSNPLQRAPAALAQGGVPVKSAMPPYKATLKADAIWEIILYVRGL